MGPVAYTRIAEIMSGRSHLQQRQAATCKDLLYKEDPKEEGGDGTGA
jgi:endo-alpha-1,4-polygalactosaminidase (GH114 family)